MRNPVKKTLAFLLAASFSLSLLNLGLASVAVEPRTVAEMLGILRVSAESAQQSYNRALFKHWVDANKDGCDTRAEVLISESRKKVTRQGKCTITSGDWLSIYDNAVIKVATKLDVDHLVPLAEAWRSGASTWTPASREAFANDLSISYALVAVSASSNRSKGDQDPANWLPKYSARVCEYIGSWIAVKYRWDLSIDPGEQVALSSKLVSCGDKAAIPVPTRISVGTQSTISTPSASPSSSSSNTPKPVVTIAPSPTATTPPSPEATVSPSPSPSASPSTRTLDPRFSSCAEAKRNGYNRKYVRGVDPEYYYYRDGDGDGIVCE
jgi:septal ring-binding cell division protein DamX